MEAQPAALLSSEATTTPQTEPTAAARKRPRGGAGSANVLISAQATAEQSLRRFSSKVCQVVQSLGSTSYLEVADKCVMEFLGTDTDEAEAKNIRRRVYDALNVLEALEIISKEKKQVQWHGFPQASSATEAHFLIQQREEQARRVESKEAKLRMLIGQMAAFKQLVRKNQETERQQQGSTAIAAAEQGGGSDVGGGSAAEGSSAAAAGSAPPPQEEEEEGDSAAKATEAEQRIYMPFLVVQTQTPSNIDCASSDDRTQVALTFEHPFSVHDDAEVLRGLGLHGFQDKATAAATVDQLEGGLPTAVVRYARAWLHAKGGGAGGAKKLATGGAAAAKAEAAAAATPTGEEEATTTTPEAAIKVGSVAAGVAAGAEEETPVAGALTYSSALPWVPSS